jgi:hypothetical protein
MIWLSHCFLCKKKTKTRREMNMCACWARSSRESTSPVNPNPLLPPPILSLASHFLSCLYLQSLATPPPALLITSPAYPLPPPCFPQPDTASPLPIRPSSSPTLYPAKLWSMRERWRRLAAVASRHACLLVRGVVELAWPYG